ncbi:MAG: TonB-dependent receptor [Lentisphaeria bacterium]|nr:TonB-dependent receptor [Lentisphaeria bacterium]
MPLNGSPGGGFDIGTMTLSNIERIEVLKGPQGGLYGSQSIGAVINIITKKVAEGGPSFEAQVSGGNHDFYQALVRMSLGSEKIKYSISIEEMYIKDSSTASFSQGARELDSFKNLSIFNKLELKLGAETYVNMSYNYAESENDIDDFGGSGPVDDIFDSVERTFENYSVGLTTTLADNVQQKFSYGYTGDTMDNTGDISFNNFELFNEIQLFNSHTDFYIADEHTVSLGYSNELQSGESIGSYKEEITINSGYLQYQYDDDFLNYLVSGRYDDFEDFGTEFTWRTAISITLVNSRLFASYGTGFKIPTFVDLFFPFTDFGSGYTYEGNLDLEPETSEGFDIGIEYSMFNGSVVISETVFYNDIDDLIDPGLFTPVNLNKVHTEGVESVIKIKFSDSLRVMFSHTYLKTEDTETHQKLARRPENTFNFLIDWKLTDALSTQLSALSVNNRIDRGGDTNYAEDYTRVDGNIRYQFCENASGFIKVENLLDEDYEDVYQFGTAPLFASAGLTMNW